VSMGPRMVRLSYQKIQATRFAGGR
jgi:hypothetical protein